MIENLVVLLDVDGVVADFVSYYLDVVRRRLKRDFRQEDVTAWDVGSALSLSDYDRELVHRDLFAPGVAYHMPIYSGAWTGVRNLNEIAQVVFVTSHLKENLTWVSDRDRWIDFHFGPSAPPTVYTHHKHLVRGDVLVDDKPSAVEKWRQANPNGLGVLWDGPWNRDANIDGAVRLNSWVDLRELILSTFAPKSAG